MSHKLSYNDNKSIANKDNYITQGFNASRVKNSGKTRNYVINNIDGTKGLMEATIEKECQSSLHFEINVNSGKIKLVLVKPDSSVETLKEVTKEDKAFTCDVSFLCAKGTNKINLVEDSYSGSFQISQGDDMIFKYLNDNIFD